MTTNTPDSLVLKNDRLHATDSFGNGPFDVLSLARASAVTGVDPVSNALIPAVSLANELTIEHIPEIRNVFFDTLRNGPAPHKFLYTLATLDVLDLAFPQLAALDGVPAGPDEYHQEGDALQHTLLVMQEYQRLNPNDVIGLLGTLAHDLGKARTDEETLPNHYGHAKNGIKPVQELVSHLNIPEYETAMTQAAEHHMRMANLLEMRPSKVIRLVDTLENDGGYGTERLLTLMEADGLGRIPQTDTNREPFDARINTAFRVLNEVDAGTVRQNHPDMDAEDVPDQVLNKRTHKFKQYLNTETV